MTKPVLFLDNNFLIHIYGQETEMMPKGAHFDAKLGAKVLDELSQKYDLRATSTVLGEATKMDQFRSIGDWFKANETGIDGQPPRVKVYQTPAFDGLKNGGEDSIAAVINSPPATRDPTLPPAADTAHLQVATANRTDFNKSGLAGNTVRTQTVMEEALVDGTVSRPTFDRYAAASGSQLTARSGFLSADEVLAGKRTFNPDGTPTGQAPWVRAATQAPPPPAAPPPPGPPEAELEAAIKKICTPAVAETIHNIPDAGLRRTLELQTLHMENVRFMRANESDLPHPDIPKDLPEPGSLAGKNLGNVDLSGLNLENMDLKGANLSKVKLTGTILAGADLQNANLRGADMRGVNMDGAALDGAKLNGADFRPLTGADGEVYHASLQGVHVQNADFSGAKMQGALVDLYEGDARGAKFISTNFTGARVEGSYAGADMKGAILTDARITPEALSGAQLAQAVNPPTGVVPSDAPVVKPVPETAAPETIKAVPAETPPPTSKFTGAPVTASPPPEVHVPPPPPAPPKVQAPPEPLPKAPSPTALESGAEGLSGVSRIARVAAPAIPAVTGALINGVTAAANGESAGQVAKATAYGAADGAFGITDARTALDSHQRPLDRWLAAGRTATATTATVAGVASFTPAAPVAVPTAVVAGVANLGLGVVQDVAYWTGLANNPGALTQIGSALVHLEHAVMGSGSNDMAAQNGRMIDATNKGTLAGDYTKALTSGDRSTAETARAEYEQHLMNLMIHGKIPKETYEQVDKLARQAFDQAERNGFHPTPAAPSAPPPATARPKQPAPQ